MFLLTLLGVGCTVALPPTMRAVRTKNVPCTAATNFSCFEVVTVPTPKAGFGELLVKLTSSSVNPSDVDEEEDKVHSTPPGVDFSGVVVAAGKGTGRLKVGDAVWGVTLGAYQEYILVLEAVVGLAPSNGLTAIEAGTIPEVSTTSIECLIRTGAPWKNTNQTVVITSGSGGTGFIAIQLAKQFGAVHVATATSGAANIEFCHDIGADIVTDYKKQEVWSVLNNNSVNVVYDNYGAKGTADAAMPSLTPDGGIYLLLPGGEDGALSKHPKAGVTQLSFGLMIPSLARLNTIKSFFEKGELKAHVDEIFDFDHIGDAFAFSKSGQVVGKIAIVPTYTM